MVSAAREWTATSRAVFSKSASCSEWLDGHVPPITQENVLMSEQRRKTPEELLQEIQSEEPRAHKGYLKIFLGYASGVGKSFRMLDEARRRRERGQDVVVGAIQPREPPDVQEVLKKLELIPLKNGVA